MNFFEIFFFCDKISHMAQTDLRFSILLWLPKCWVRGMLYHRKPGILFLIMFLEGHLFSICVTTHACIAHYGVYAEVTS